MISNRRTSGFCAVAGIGVVLFCSLLLGGAAAQGKGPAGGETIQAVLVSDIHFEPFFDPGRRCCLLQRR